MEAPFYVTRVPNGCFMYLDIAFHVLLWVTVIVLDVVSSFHEDNTVETKRYIVPAVWLDIFAALVVLVTLSVAIISANLRYEFTTSISPSSLVSSIYGCLNASILLSSICIVAVLHDAKFSDQWHTFVVWGVILKVVLSIYFMANMTIKIANPYTGNTSQATKKCKANDGSRSALIGNGKV